MRLQLWFLNILLVSGFQETEEECLRIIPTVNTASQLHRTLEIVPQQANSVAHITDMLSKVWPIGSWISCVFVSILYWSWFDNDLAGMIYGSRIENNWY